MKTIFLRLFPFFILPNAQVLTAIKKQKFNLSKIKCFIDKLE